jgi:hypothetical protein
MRTHAGITKLQVFYFFLFLTVARILKISKNKQKNIDIFNSGYPIVEM